MRNDEACNITSQSIIQIRMNDVLLRTLIDVRYVPELQKNLISLNTLDTLNCLYRTEGRVLRVYRSFLTVTKGKLKNGLYILQGSTMVSTASIYSTFDSIKPVCGI